MKVIIAGSRSFNNKPEIYTYIDLAIKLSKFEIIEVISGGARGVDLAGERWADYHNIPIKKFLPNWNKFGKSAGYKRNIEMANYAEALILIWDGKSKGSKHMLDIAKEKGLPVFVYNLLEELNV